MKKTSLEFHLGLCLAGAVSAGAYTAGVLDYLLEALENWEQQKASGKTDIPQHQVKIKVIGGASAGGMTGIMTLAHLLKTLQPVQSLSHSLETRPENTLYHSWVDMTQPDMLDPLLDTSDIKDNPPKSFLNATFIQQLAQRALPISNAVLNKPYVHESLQCFVSLTHLNGRSYSTSFKSDIPSSNRYITTRHDAFMGFALNPKHATNGWIAIDWNDPSCVQAMQDAAIATGAFPVGLKAHTFAAQLLTPKEKILNTHSKQTFVDGGVINNEPFEKVMELLHETTDHQMIASKTNSDSNHFDRTMIMIDPFPSEMSDYKNDTTIGAVAIDTFSAMLNQCRSKPEDLADALDSENYSKFLISPIRYEDTHVFEGNHALACGALGGFGGFLHRDFRVHDFFLGRANCERFLRHHFAVPAATSNPIFVKGYENCATNVYLTKNGLLPIIPLFTIENEKPYSPRFSHGQKFPKIMAAELNRYKRKIKLRVQAVLLSLSKDSWIEKTLLWIGAKIVINEKITTILLDKIRNELRERNMLR